MLTLEVPDGFQNPLPKEWSVHDTALALEAGATVVQCLKRREALASDAASLGREETLRSLEQMLDRQRDEKVAKLEAQLVQIQTELAEANSKASAHHADKEALHATLLHAHTVQLATREHEIYTEMNTRLAAATAGADARAAAAIQQLDVERGYLRDQMQRIETGKRAIDEELRLERERTAALEAQCAHLKGAANKGTAFELSLCEELGNYGIFAQHVAKGSHNNHFHDIISSTSPLIKGVDVRGVPTYTNDTASVRLSIEAKNYETGNKLTQEREKFLRVRKGMMDAGRAECFLFAATAEIPYFPRRHFEILKCDNGQLSVSGYIGFDGVSSTEIAIMAHLIHTLQTHLLSVAPEEAVPMDDKVCELSEWASELVDRLGEHIKRVDNAHAAMLKTTEQMDILRQDAASMLFSTLQSVESVLGRGASKGELYQALDLLVSGSPPPNKRYPPLLKSKTHAKAIADKMSKRRRDDEAGA